MTKGSTKIHFKDDQGNDGTAFVITKKMLLSGIGVVVTSLAIPAALWAHSMSSDVKELKTGFVEMKQSDKEQGFEISGLGRAAASQKPAIENNSEAVKKLAGVPARLDSIDKNIDRIFNKLDNLKE